jgi:deoxyribodipyrimidine photo-lyase
MTNENENSVRTMRERIRKLNSDPERTGAKYVLYWTQMNRRVNVNHALLYAVHSANRLGLPLLVYEGLTCTYRKANDRMHTFILQNVPAMAGRLRKRGIGYLFYLRRRKADANDVLYRLATQAAAVVTDDYPTFIAAGHNASVPPKIGVAYYAVDSSCIVPMSRHDKRNYGAYTIRPRIHKMLPDYLKPFTEEQLIHPWKPGLLTEALAVFHTPVSPDTIPALVASCEIDHSIPPSTTFHGGQEEAERHLEEFLENRLRRYAADRNEPTRHATSNMSPYLHFGMISALEVALRAKEHAEKHGYMAGEYLEELIVRRELAFNFAHFTPHADSLSVLPDWCLKTMREHAADKRDPVYTAEEFELATTHDQLWNATQRELLLRGKIHGYYRMYWGKKIIEWSPTYEKALEIMIDFHDRYALDGRDPNTYTNILWCFGLHDRPWGARPVFGSLRWMSFDGMKRKSDINSYIQEIAYLQKTGKDAETP